MARDGLLVDTDILIDYLKGIGPARALLDSPQFTFYYSSWTKKELLAKTGLSARERREVEELLARYRLVPVEDAFAGKYWVFFKKYESQGLRQADHCSYTQRCDKTALPTHERRMRHRVQRGIENRLCLLNRCQ